MVPSRRLEGPGVTLVANDGQAEVGDLERAVLGDHEVARLDVAVAAQSLADRVLHPQAELDAQVQGRARVELGRPDPLAEVAAGDQLQDDVRLAVEHLDRVGVDDVRVEPRPDPESAPRRRTGPSSPRRASHSSRSVLIATIFRPGGPRWSWAT